MFAGCGMGGARWAHHPQNGPDRAVCIRRGEHRQHTSPRDLRANGRHTHGSAKHTRAHLTQAHATGNGSMVPAYRCGFGGDGSGSCHDASNARVGGRVGGGGGWQRRRGGATAAAAGNGGGGRPVAGMPTASPTTVTSSATSAAARQSQAATCPAAAATSASPPTRQNVARKAPPGKTPRRTPWRPCGRSRSAPPSR